jgi:arylsulfatase A-like enzyme
MKPSSTMAWVAAPALFFLAGCGDDTPGGPRTRNVVLIVADTLRADRLGCYGYERDTSPAIDALAEEGVVWESCHSQACWTVPSMISLMSGVPVTRKETVVPPFSVLPEVLQQHGLTTAAFLANAAVGVDRGFERGFDDWHECYEMRAPEVVDHFETWYRAWSAEDDGRRPGFFAWVHFIDPHHPYEPLPEHDQFEGPRPGYDELEPRWKAEAPRVAEYSDAPGLDAEHAMQRMNDVSNRYDGEVRAVDAGVRELVRLLREGGDYDDTLIVFCSDHGEMLYEHENFPYLIQERVERDGGLPDGVMDLFGSGHRPWYYEDLWRTPLIAVGPGMPAGERRAGLAANLDIFPTVLEALDLPPPTHLAGESLFGGREPARERVFAYGHRTTAVLDKSGAKLVEHWPRSYLMTKDDVATEGRPLQLFDLGSDRAERNDLSAADAERVAELTAAIERWRTEHERAVIDVETRRMQEVLDQLGYTGDDPGEEPEED